MTQTIGEIYETVDHADAWPLVLGRIAAMVKSDAAALTFEQLTRRSVVHASYNVDPALIHDYEHHYNSVNILMDRGKKFFTPGAVICSHELCSDETLLRSEYYQDCLRKYDIFHIAAAVVAMTPANAVLLHCVRGRHPGPFTMEQQATIKLLIPHLNRAARMHQVSADLLAARETLDHLTTGVLLLGDLLRVLYFNRSADKILSSKDGLALENGRLSAVGASQQISLQRLLETHRRYASTTLAGAAVESMKIERKSGRRPYSVTVSPIAGSHWLQMGESPEVIVFIRDLEQGAKPSRQRRLIEMHGLTAAEASLADQLIESGDLDRACEVLTISRNTGRAHLRSIFAKVDVKRQSELVATLIRGCDF